MPFNNSNLYKFIASFGAVLFVLSLLFYYTSTERNRMQEKDLQRKIVEYSQEREAYIGIIKAYELAMADTAMQVPSTIDEQNIKPYKNKIDLRTKQLELEKQFMDDQVAYYKSLGQITCGTGSAGLLLIIIGVIFWAVKLQRPANNLLRREVRRQMHE